MSYTKGPWKVIQFDNEQTCIFPERKGPLIAIVSIGHDRPDGEANTQLIAACPLMIGQLEQGIEAMREALRRAANADFDAVHALLSGVIAGNEMAIQKATGAA